MHILIFQDIHACYIWMFYYKVLEKNWVVLYWTGCLELPIHGHYSTTAGCEDFCYFLLFFGGGNGTIHSRQQMHGAGQYSFGFLR